jgi:flagellar hook assembly protein FlgD
MHVLDTTTINQINDLENKWNASCYPNPFRNSTRIKYAIQRLTNVKVEVYDINGLKVKTLLSKNQQAGNYSLIWDGTNDSGNPVSSGIYYCRCRSGEKNETIKMILMR